MARKTRTQLKAYFNRGDKPLESQFSDFIDSLFPDQQQDTAASDLQIADEETDLGLEITIPFNGVARLEPSLTMNFDTSSPCLVEMYFKKNGVKIAASSRFISNASPTTLGNDYRVAAWAHLETVEENDVITLAAIATVGDILCQVPSRAMIVTTTPE